MHPPDEHSSEIARGLLQARYQAIIPALGKILIEPSKEKVRKLNAPQKIVTTGVGSSEAHARYLAWLINTYTSAGAEFLPLSIFCASAIPAVEGRELVLFSQGLSPNSKIALDHSKSFVRTHLFTSSRQEQVAAVVNSEITVIPIGCDEERGLLVRILGPCLAYVRAIQWVNTYWPNAIPQLAHGAIIDALASACKFSQHLQTQNVATHLNQNGIVLLGMGPFARFGMNLASKLSESLYLPVLGPWDILSFTHGPFQECIAHPRPIIVCSGHEPWAQQLQQRMHHLLPKSMPAAFIIGSLPWPWRILEYEMALNAFVLNEVHQRNLNPAHWPGKGMEDPLYSLDHSESITHPI